MRCDFTDPSTGFTHSEIIDELQEEIAAQGMQIYQLTKALQASLKHQAHYGELLNMHDGGQRRIFKSVDEWLARLDEVEKQEDQLVRAQKLAEDLSKGTK